MSGNVFRGVSADQDARFGDKMKKLMKTTKFPEHFDTKVDMKKVNIDVMLPWITEQVSGYLGFEDEVVIGYIESQLRETDGSRVNPKQMQLYLTGFLEKNTAAFMRDLWSLLISAQGNEHGIPVEFLEKKKEELRRKREEQERIAAALQAKKEEVERKIAEESAKWRAESSAKAGRDRSPRSDIRRTRDADTHNRSPSRRSPERRRYRREDDWRKRDKDRGSRLPSRRADWRHDDDRRYYDGAHRSRHGDGRGQYPERRDYEFDRRGRREYDRGGGMERGRRRGSSPDRNGRRRRHRSHSRSPHHSNSSSRSRPSCSRSPSGDRLDEFGRARPSRRPRQSSPLPPASRGKKREKTTKKDCGSSSGKSSRSVSPSPAKPSLREEEKSD